ncbi:MAG: GNAT family N-acetyltransferase [Pseudomonadota bacterium]
MIPELETERLLLRQWREADVEPFATLYADDKTAFFIGGVAPMEQVWRRLASYVGHWVLRGYGMWALEEKASGRFVGYSGLWFPLGFAERDLAWGLVPDAHGSGFGVEAARRVKQYAFEDLGWSELFSNIDDENTPSIRLAERLGAVRERNVVVLDRPGAIYRHSPDTAP